MEIPSDTKQRLIDADQLHLIAYWSELNDGQRQMLLHDLNEVDFVHVRKAYEDIQQELLPNSTTINSTSKHDCDAKNIDRHNIDALMEPVPENVTGSINEASNEQIEIYYRRG
jgi:hypothetical protein